MVTDGERVATIDLPSGNVSNIRSWKRGSSMAAAFSPDGKHLAISRHREIWVIDPKTGDVRATLKGTGSIIRGLIFHPDSNRLLASGAEGTVDIWDVSESAQIGSIDFQTSRARNVLAISPDGSLVAAVRNSPGQTIKVARMPE